MAQIQGPGGDVMVVESAGKAGRVVQVPRGAGYVLATQTGTMAAALGANSLVFAMRLDPSSSVRAFIDQLVIDFTTIIAFTTPLTAGRRLGLYRGAGAAPSGGTAIATVAHKHSTAAASQFKASEGGDARIATTAALTDTGITWESDPIALIPLLHLGAAGAHEKFSLDFASEHHEVILEPGQVLGIRNPAAMDAAGTWELTVNAQWREAALLTATS